MKKTQVSLIIRNGTVVPMDSENRILTNGAVAVKGNTIVEVGNNDVIVGRYSADRILDATGRVVMPGLVDTYGHAGHGLIKGIYHPEHGWPTGQFYFHATSEDWWHAEGLLSAVERIRFGVTTGLTVVGAIPARMDSTVFAQRQAQSAEETGVRSVIAVGPPDPLITHLPEPWSGTFWQAGRPVVKQFSFRDTIENTVRIINDWHHGLDERIQVALHYPYLFGRQAAHPRHPFVYDPAVHVPLMIEKAEQVKELADRYQVLLHSHAFAGSVSFALKHLVPMQQASVRCPLPMKTYSTVPVRLSSFFNTEPTCRFPQTVQRRTVPMTCSRKFPGLSGPSGCVSRIRPFCRPAKLCAWSR